MNTLEVRDRDQWNRIVLSFPEYHLYQGYEWGEIRREAGWVPYRYAVLDGDRAIAAVSIAAVKLNGSPFSLLDASRGPLMEWTNPRAWEGLRQAIREVADRTGAVFLRVSPGVSNAESAVRDALVAHDFRHLPNDWTWWNGQRTIVTMPLGLSDTELTKRMRRGTSRYLERAIQKGADVRIDASADSLRGFYKLFRDSATRKGYPARSFQYIQSLSRHYLSKGDGCLAMVSYGGVNLSGVLFLQYGRKAYAMHLGNDDVSPLGRDLRGGYAAYWWALRWCRDNGCELSDWGGSRTGFPPRPEDSGYSLYQFKAGFGCSIEYLTGYYDMVFRPRLYRTARLGEERLLPFAYRMRARLNGWFERTRKTRTQAREPDQISTV